MLMMDIISKKISEIWSQTRRNKNVDVVYGMDGIDAMETHEKDNVEAKGK